MIAVVHDYGWTIYGSNDSLEKDEGFGFTKRLKEKECETLREAFEFIFVNYYEMSEDEAESVSCVDYRCWEDGGIVF